MKKVQQQHAVRGARGTVIGVQVRPNFAVLKVTCFDAAWKKKKNRHLSKHMKSCWEGWITAFPQRFLDYDALFFFLCG